jgi:hypothetical protein
MRLLSETELKNTRDKLARLEAFFAHTEQETCDDEYLRDIERESISRLIIKLKQEVIQSEIRRAADCYNLDNSR